LQQLNHGLHDTVINTLGAVRGGIPAPMVDSVPERARDDLRQMSARIDGYDPDANDLSVQDLPDSALTQAARLHLNANIQPLQSADGGPGPVVPQRVLRGMRDCINEALLNVSKHAGTAAAAVLVERVGVTLTVTITDNGPGLPVGSAPPQTLLQRATRNGIRVTASEAPGGGTRIELWWSPEVSAVTNAAEIGAGTESIARSLTSMAVRISAWAGGSYIITTVLATSASTEITELAPMIIGGGLIAAATMASHRRFPLATSMMVVLVVAIPAVLSLSMLTNDLCGISGTTFPPSSWAALLALTAILLSSRVWQGMAAAGVYVVSNLTLVILAIMNTGCGPAYTSNFITDCAGLLAIGLFRRRIDRYFSDAAITARLKSSAQDETAALQRRSAESADRNHAMLAASRNLLEQLADGSADPTDPRVREAAGTQERYLRSILRIDPELGPLAEELVAVVGAAARSGVMADITVLSSRWYGGLAPDLDEVNGLGRTLTSMMTACPSSTRLRITVDASSRDWLTVVANSEDLSAERAAGAIDRFAVESDVTSLDGQTLVEFHRRAHL
ncbi:MAG: hypothetical protein WCI74_20525, partial [Actinomycetes bacterium]